ncbi:MAG: hypothetical protein N2258_00690 [Brevinematales bacterium]|nr:hypothetical protein [Brevinematales bacterium]
MFTCEIMDRILQILYSFSVSILIFLIIAFSSKDYYISSTMSNLYSEILIYTLIFNFIFMFVIILIDKKSKLSEKVKNLILLILFNFVSMFVFLFMAKDGKKFNSFYTTFIELIHSLTFGFSMIIFNLIFTKNINKLYLLIGSIVVFLSALYSFWHLVKFSRIKIGYKIIWGFLILFIPYLFAPTYYYVSYCKEKKVI